MLVQCGILRTMTQWTTWQLGVQYRTEMSSNAGSQVMQL